MRRNTKIIMLVVAIAFVGLMVFEWGMDASGRSNTAAVGEVGRVNGTVVSYQYWTQTFRSLTDQARLQKGAPLNDLEIDYIEDQTWNQIVNQILIEQEIRRQGIAVTDEEVQLAFQTSPPPWLQQNELFQTGGQFDYAKYQAFFSGPAVDPTLLQQIEAYYRDVLPRARLFEALGSGIYISDSELWSIYRDRSEQVQVKYAVIDPETQVDDSEVSISEDELRGYYDAHRDDFHQPANALVTLVQIVRTPEAADTAAALEAANRIREQALEGADFEELARANSADRGSAESGGDLGWFGPNDMTPDFEAAAFAMEVDEISEPVLTLYGYHVIKMHEKEEDRVHASHVLIEIGLRGESEDNLLGRVDQLERIALTQGLDAAVDSVGLAGAQITLAEGSDFVPGLGPFGPVQHRFHVNR
jgi:parvulin-like peptidyl-prolyl isomerase